MVLRLTETSSIKSPVLNINLFTGTDRHRKTGKSVAAHIANSGLVRKGTRFVSRKDFISKKRKFISVDNRDKISHF